MTTSFSRRDFLKTSGVALAAATLPAPVRADETAPPAKKRDIKKGIMWGCIPGDASVMDKFKMVQDAGFDGIEIESEVDPAEALKAREATGVQIPTVVCSTHWKLSIADNDPAVRAKGLEGLKTALRNARDYGSSTILFVPGIVNKKTSYADVYARSQAEIKKALPLAEELGVKIGIENVWNYFLLSPLEAAKYIDEFNSPAVSWHFDIGNCMSTAWPEHWIPVLNQRIHKLHIKEFSRKKRDEQGLWKGFHVEYFEGDNDWPTVMKALDAVGYKGWGTAEPAYTPPGVDTPTRLKQVSGFLDRIFAA